MSQRIIHPCLRLTQFFLNILTLRPFDISLRRVCLCFFPSSDIFYFLRPELNFPLTICSKIMISVERKRKKDNIIVNNKKENKEEKKDIKRQKDQKDSKRQKRQKEQKSKKT